jgi:hypothetical protein
MSLEIDETETGNSPPLVEPYAGVEIDAHEEPGEPKPDKKKKKPGPKPGKKQTKTKVIDAVEVERRKPVTAISDTRKAVMRAQANFAEARAEHLSRHPESTVSELPENVFDVPVVERKGKKLPPKLCADVVIGATTVGIRTVRTIKRCKVQEMPTFSPAMKADLGEKLSEASQYLPPEFTEKLFTIVAAGMAFAPLITIVAIEAVHPGATAGAIIDVETQEQKPNLALVKNEDE